jgi:hypothetical protein
MPVGHYLNFIANGDTKAFVRLMGGTMIISALLLESNE